MVYFSKTIVAAIAAALLAQVVAHPGHDVSQEIAERNAFFKNSARRGLSHCSSSLRKRGVEEASIKRRALALEKARAERGLPLKRRGILERDATDKSHLSSLDVTPQTSGVEEIIFGNATCLLSPEGEEGPYYVKGEYIRSNIKESQPGVEIVIDLQFIDVETCEPIEGIAADIWHCNSTGVYAGVIANGNGNTADLTNLNKTFCRGLQTTDAEGAAQFTSVFPGHYSGRATHVHVESHLSGTVLPNGTYSGGSIAHVGQFFFDQSLITEVEALSPYSENTVSITTNAADRIVQGELVNGADPFLNYVLLGDTVSDGLFMWVTFTVNKTATYTSSPAAELTANGGEEVSGGGGAGGGGGGGTFPSGGGSQSGMMPSGVTMSGAVPSGSAASNISVIVNTLSSSRVSSTSLVATSTSITKSSTTTSSSTNSTTSVSVTATVTSSGGNKRPGPYLPGYGKGGFMGLLRG